MSKYSHSEIESKLTDERNRLKRLLDAMSALENVENGRLTTPAPENIGNGRLTTTPTSISGWRRFYIIISIVMILPIGLYPVCDFLIVDLALVKIGSLPIRTVAIIIIIVLFFTALLEIRKVLNDYNVIDDDLVTLVGFKLMVSFWAGIPIIISFFQRSLQITFFVQNA